MVKVNVKNGTLDQKEIDAYVQYAIEANPGKLVTELDIDIDGDFANLTYHFGEIPFDRIRRITGYLVGTLDSTGVKAVTYTYNAWGKLMSMTGNMELAVKAC